MPSSSDTFLVGTADGRILSYDAQGEASYVQGQGHTNLVSSLTSGTDGKVYTAGFDDRVREVEGQGFVCVQTPGPARLHMSLLNLASVVRYLRSRV